jgi:hypothetical protein
MFAAIAPAVLLHGRDIGQSSPFIQAVDQLRRMPFVSSLATEYLLEGMGVKWKSRRCCGTLSQRIHSLESRHRNHDCFADWIKMAESNGTGAIAGKDARGRFAKGHKLSKGRPPGARNKLGEKFLDDLAKEWRRSGVKALERASTTDPVAFCKIVANLLPKELAASLNVGVTQEITLKLEEATWSQAYDNWGKFIGAQEPKLIEGDR